MRRRSRHVELWDQKFGDTLTPQIGNRGVDGDAVQPRARGAASAIFRTRLICALEGLLSEVLGGRGIEHDATNGSVHRKPEPLVELFKLRYRVRFPARTIEARPHAAASRCFTSKGTRWTLQNDMLALT